MASSESIVTPEGRFSYMFLWHARAHKDAKPDSETGLKPKKYNATLMFHKSVDLSAIKALHAGVKQEAYPDYFPKGARGEHAVMDGAVEYPVGHPEHEHYKDYNLLRISRSESYGRPDIMDRDKNPIITESDFYSGCHGHAVISFYSYQGGTGGINCEVHGVMKTRDDEPLGTAPVDSKAMFENMGAPQNTAGTENGKQSPPPPPKKAPPPAPNQKVMTEKANGYTFEEMLDSGWTEEGLRAEGYLV